jgi:hypothetical protein
MFTPVSTRAASAYQRVGVETSINGADPHQLVVLLFDGLLDSLTKVSGAMVRGDIQEKSRYLNKSIQILEDGLRAVLNEKEAVMWPKAWIRSTATGAGTDPGQFEQQSRDCQFRDRTDPTRR